MLKNYKKYSDEELVAKLSGKRKEAEKAFAAIYHRYSSHVYSYTKSIVRDHDDTEDIFQEVFSRFYKNVEAGSEITNLHSYLIKISRNLCLNYKRDQKPQVQIEDWHKTIDNDLNIEQKEMFDLVMRALDLIDDKYSEAFILKKIEGFKLKEIAEILNISLEGAKTRVNRARIKLLEILDPYINDQIKVERIEK
jgi:RNA polymerase sigma-70 factor (ECF subfamily)